MELIIGTATAPFPAEQEPDHVIGAWCAELRPDNGPSRRWRGVIHRTTPERLTAHAIIEGLRHLSGPTRVRVHLPAAPAQPDGGLGDCLSASVTRHTLTYTASDLNLDGYSRPLLRNLKKPAVSSRARPYVPVQIPHLNLPTILTHDGMTVFLRVASAPHDPVLLTRNLTEPFLGDSFEFAPNGIQVPGTSIREVLR